MSIYKSEKGKETLVMTYLLEGRGHMSELTDKEKQMIVDFLN